MLRPATPLSILLFVAFVLLLLSVISTPIIKGIPLASFQGVNFGVFGFCQGKQCSPIGVGYQNAAFTSTNSNNADFSLPTSDRHSLSSILIVHPVAAFLTLICFILAFTAHFHSPSHSSRYLLALNILLIPTLLITLLAFLVDILLFVPHLAWGGWIVLASTILIVASFVVACAMRRTLSSKKARRKRIAENAEMNGENFYNRQNAIKADSPPLAQQPTAPMVNGALGADQLPSFATFDVNQNRRPSDEDRIPLNSRSPSNRTVPSSAGGLLPPPPQLQDGTERYGGPGRGAPLGMRGGRGGRGGYNGPRDEFGNPLPPSTAFGPGPPDGVRRQYSNETLSSQGSRGRGRGGRSRGYGRGGPMNGGRGGPYRGGPSGSGMGGNGRGMPMGAMAAGAGAGMLAGEAVGRGQRGPPPGYGDGYPPQGRGGPGPGPYNQEMAAPYGAPGPYGRKPSPGPPSAPGYGRQRSPGPPSAPGGYGYGGRNQSPGPPGTQLARAESPPPLPGVDSMEPSSIGQAVEMDASTGSPSQTPRFGPMHQLRDSDSDVQGFVGLQRNKGALSPTSLYSSNESYVPPRAAWAGGVGRNGTPPLVRDPSPIHRSPVELPTQHFPSPDVQQQRTSPTHARMNSADNYYEDIDPRFDELNRLPSSSSAVPVPLRPGNNALDQPQMPGRDVSANGHLEPSSSYDTIQEGARSPAESEASNFTSVSQRGINPEWRPPPGQGMGMGMGGVPNRRPVGNQPPRDLLLGSNPDFMLPVAGGRGGRTGPPSRGGRGPPGMIPGVGGNRYHGGQI